MKIEDILNIESQLSKNGKKYRNLMFKLCENRINSYKQINEIEEEKILLELEKFYNDNNFYKDIDTTQISQDENEILNEILPGYFDFLYCEHNNGAYCKSYLNIFPFAHHFVKQIVYKVTNFLHCENEVTVFGTPIKLGDGLLQLLTDSIDTPRILTKIIPEDFERLQTEYEFIKYYELEHYGLIPHFRKK